MRSNKHHRTGMGMWRRTRTRTGMEITESVLYSMSLLLLLLLNEWRRMSSRSIALLNLVGRMKRVYLREDKRTFQWFLLLLSGSPSTYTEAHVFGNCLMYSNVVQLYDYDLQDEDIRHRNWLSKWRPSSYHLYDHPRVTIDSSVVKTKALLTCFIDLSAEGHHREGRWSVWAMTAVKSAYVCVGVLKCTCGAD